MNESKVKVLYIGGSGRSGTTLLLRLLGQFERFVAVGELWHIWHFSFDQNQLCGCSQPFRECEFWKAVVAKAFGGFQHVDVDAMRALRRSVQDDRYIPQLMVPWLRTAEYQERLHAYLSVLSSLYRAIQKVSGCGVIVDSSKGSRYLSCLREVPGIDTYTLHLVRDSRAVAHSWQRTKRKPEVYWKTEYMEKQGAMMSAMEWIMTNSALMYYGPNYLRLRYEDLLGSPRDWLLRIAAFLGEDVSAMPFLDNRSVASFGVDHTAMGNPNRFQHGKVELRRDTEWQTSMPRSRRYITTALTWPLLWRYGYFTERGIKS
jgi:hypothetical protein